MHVGLLQLIGMRGLLGEVLNRKGMVFLNGSRKQYDKR